MKILVELLYNFGIFVSIAIIVGNIGKDRKYSAYYQGLVLGIASIIGMLHPLVIAKGLIFDGRSVLISIAGAYYGPVAAGISGLMSLILRVYQGGIGMPMGVSVILMSTFIGIGFYYYSRYNNKLFSLKNLYIMSIINHIFMTLFMFLLPRENAIFALKNIAPAVVILYPLLTILIAIVINSAENKRSLLKQLKEKDETIKGISSNFQSGMIYQVKVFNNSRSFTFVSDSVTKLYGCSVEEVKKNPNLIYGKIHSDYITKLMKAEEDSIKNLSIFRTEVKMINPDGSYRWSLLVSHPRKEPDGSVLFDGMEFIINDRKKLEEKLTKEKDSSERNNRAKSDFLISMSHELRTPMNGILGLSELLSLTTLNSEQKSLVDDIRTSADNLLLIINDILDISKIETGKLTVDTSEFQLEKLTADILDLLAYNANKKNIELIYSVDNNITTLLNSDTGKIRQILINLLGNAIKFTEKGYVFLEIKRLKEDNDSFDLEFSIKDTGIGIKKDTISALLLPFDGDENLYTKGQYGNGLGLTITKNLLDILGTKLNIESKVGEGSRFFFSINIKKSKKKNQLITYDFKHLSVLYIHNLDLNRTLIKKVLEDAGITVFTAESSLKAFDILKSSFEIPIILLDMAVHEFDSIEIAKNIREKCGKEKEILFLTPLNLKDRLDEINNLGVQHFLLKPLKSNELLKKIGELSLEFNNTILNEKKETKKTSKIQKTIFIIEDNYINLNLAIKIIEKLGDFRIIKANNGIEAIEMYKKENPDLIFLDIQMPVMNGFDAFEEIKAIAKEKNILMPKVIALTAYDSEKDKEKCRNCGMDDFVSKPFTIEHMKLVLEKHL